MDISNHTVLSVGQTVIVFNCTEWSKTGDIPNSNEKYWQKARILNIRENELLADVEFESGLKSNGHFIRCIIVS